MQRTPCKSATSFAERLSLMAAAIAASMHLQIRPLLFFSWRYVFVSDAVQIAFGGTLSFSCLALVVGVQTVKR